MPKATAQTHATRSTAAARPAPDRLASRPFALTREPDRDQQADNGKSTYAAGPSFSFGKLPSQAKLTVGAVDDPLEHEADRIADQVIRMPGVSLVPSRLSRKCTACEEPEGQYRLQTKSAGSVQTPDKAPPIVDEVLRSSGQPLDAGVRSFFEPRFGADFRDVRIHLSDQAAKSARIVNSLAYTVGQHIVFGDTRFDPSAKSGRLLLAHELTHTLQQSVRSRTIRGGESRTTDSANLTGDSTDFATNPITQVRASVDAARRGSGHPGSRAIVARQISHPDSSPEPDPDCPPDLPYRIGSKRGPGSADPAIVPICSSSPIPMPTPSQNPSSTNEEPDNSTPEPNGVDNPARDIPPTPATSPPQTIPPPDISGSSPTSDIPQDGEPTRNTSGTNDAGDSDFEDDPLSDAGFGPNDQTIRVRPGPVRTTLIRPTRPRMTDIDGYVYNDPRLKHLDQKYDPGAWVQSFLGFFNLSPALDPLSTDLVSGQKYLFRRASILRFMTLAEVINVIVSEGAADGQTIDPNVAESAVAARLGTNVEPEPSDSRLSFSLSVSAVRTGHFVTKTGQFAEPDNPGAQEAFQITWELHKENASGPEFSWIVAQATQFQDPANIPGSKNRWEFQSGYTGFQAAWVFSFLKGSLQIGPIIQGLAGLQRGQQTASSKLTLLPTGQVAAGDQIIYAIPGTDQKLQIGGQFAAAYTAPSGAPTTIDFSESVIIQWKF
jgi:hypothetical protein